MAEVLKDEPKLNAFAYRMAMAWQHLDDPEKVAPWFLRDWPGFALVPDLQPLPSEAVFDKITMSAFEGTPLTITLRDCGVSAIAIAGNAMEVGIRPLISPRRTIRSAVMLQTPMSFAAASSVNIAALRPLALAEDGDSLFHLCCS